MCVWEDKGRCFSFTHVEVEFCVDYPEKSRLELEVQAEFLGVTSNCSIRCSWVLVVPGSFVLNAVSALLFTCRRRSPLVLICHVSLAPADLTQVKTGFAFLPWGPS